jgi:hypothetical protein
LVIFAAANKLPRRTNGFMHHGSLLPGEKSVANSKESNPAF